jgi:hypothetical protein
MRDGRTARIIKRQFQRYLEDFGAPGQEVGIRDRNKFGGIRVLGCLDYEVWSDPSRFSGRDGNAWIGW